MTESAAATKMALAPVSPRTLEPKDMFEQFERIYDSIARRAFEIFEGDGRMFGRDLDNWFQAESELLHPLKVNMSETDGQLTLQAEVPGFTGKDLEIRVEPRRLTISGKRETSQEQKKGKMICEEHRSNEILRVIDLPADVKASNVTATLKNGMLELRMSKAATSSDAKPVRVAVKSA